METEKSKDYILCDEQGRIPRYEGGSRWPISQGTVGSRSTRASDALTVGRRMPPLSIIMYGHRVPARTGGRRHYKPQEV